MTVRFVPVVDTTDVATYRAFVALYEDFETATGRTVAMPDSVTVNRQDEAAFARFFAEAVYMFFVTRIRIQ